MFKMFVFLFQLANTQGCTPSQKTKSKQRKNKSKRRKTSKRYQHCNSIFGTKRKNMCNNFEGILNPLNCEPLIYTYTQLT